ncbi:MAG: hypothetical protein EOR72_21015 [Mesorhizobium sp.]|uniref:hypothetical protein n=1 Tax=Mesorhizobium sp. TaxID=1871066 RepID=UPI000FE5558F|nr:hypothetical protein [Mesorhizobium sp.]RWM12510.1 MAG: hypothetical protein EOR72_21015 [Mesorhizobium sp.]
MDRFIAKENIKHFVDRHETEGDGCTRAVLWQLLVAEIDKIRAVSDALVMLEDAISRIDIKISQIKAADPQSALQRQHLEILKNSERYLFPDASLCPSCSNGRGFARQSAPMNAIPRSKMEQGVKHRVP